MVATGGVPSGAPVSSRSNRQWEIVTPVSSQTREERLARELAVLELSRRMLSSRATNSAHHTATSRETDKTGSRGTDASGWNGGGPHHHHALEEGGANTAGGLSPEEFAAAFERYMAGCVLQQVNEAQQQQHQQQHTPFTSADTAALLSSAVDLSGLREGVQMTSSSGGRTNEAARSSSSSSSSFPSSSSSSSRVTGSHSQLASAAHAAAATAAAEGAAARSGGELEGRRPVVSQGQDATDFQTFMAEFASGDAAEFLSGAGGGRGSTTAAAAVAAAASGRDGTATSNPSHLHEGLILGRGGGSQEEDLFSTSLFSRLMQECQSHCGADFDLNSEQVGAANCIRMGGEGSARLAAVSAELLAFLQQHHLNKLAEKPETAKRLLASANSTACNSNINSRRTSNCSPGAEDEEEVRAYKRRFLEMHLLDQRRTSFASSSSSSGSSDMRLLAASLAGPREGGECGGEGTDAAGAGAVERRAKQPGHELVLGGVTSDSPSNPSSPSYLAELQLIERVAGGGDPFLQEDALGGSSFRGPLGYYSVCEGAGKDDCASQRLYPIVRGVSRDNTKKRWAVYWKGYRRYFYDKFFESCVEAYRRAVQFRQQATTAAAAVTATGNPAHLIAAGLHGSPGGGGSNAKHHQLKAEHSECVAAALASAAAAVASQSNGRKGKYASPAAGGHGTRDDRTVVCLYKEAILFILEDLRNNVLAQYLTSRAALCASAATTTIGQAASPGELAAATTAKRLMDQTLLMHTNVVGNATSTAELQPSLMIIAPCLEELKLPSQQTPQQQLSLMQSILAMHIQQLVLLSRYLNKGIAALPEGGAAGSAGEQSRHPDVKGESEQTETATGPVHDDLQEQQTAPANAGSTIGVPA